MDIEVNQVSEDTTPLKFSGIRSAEDDEVSIL